jgi:hypothetical protein
MILIVCAGQSHLQTHCGFLPGSAGARKQTTSRPNRRPVKSING